METIGRELFANPTRLRTALLLAPVKTGEAFTAVALAAALGLSEGAVLRELVVLATMGMVEAAPHRAGTWVLMTHPLWRVIAATDQALDQVTLVDSGHRLRLTHSGNPGELA